MTNSQTHHEYAPGDPVLATLQDLQIPGVVTDVQDGRILVELAQPWMDESGQPTTTVALGENALSPLVGGTGASNPALTG